MAQQKGGGGADSSMEMWVFLIVVMFLIGFWLMQELFWIYATGWRWLRIAELWTASMLMPDALEQWTGWDFEGGLTFLLATDPMELNGTIVGAFDNIYVRFFNWLPGLLIGFAGAKLFMNAENVSLTYNMESLLIKMSSAFPGNKAFIGVHPELTSLDFYPDDPETYNYSMAMTERQFAECVPPLGLMDEAKRSKRLNKPIWDGEKGFDDELCRLSFEKQVGPLYLGYNRLSDYEKKLFDLFRNKILIRRKEVMPIIKNYMIQIVDDRLERRAFSSNPKENAKVDIVNLPQPSIRMLAEFASHKALVSALISIVDSNMKAQGTKYRVKEVETRRVAANKDLKSVLRAVMADDRMSKHAFTYTGLMSLLIAAREGSTLPPSSFRWLKNTNRSLWYALNCPGKKTSFTESGGAFAHWLLELDAKMAVPHAEVTEAIEALRVALDLPVRGGADKVLDEWG